MALAFCVLNFCRYEAFNSVIRAHNIYGNKHAPSRDIARNMAILEYVRYICSGGIYNEGCSTKGLPFHTQIKKCFMEFMHVTIIIVVDRA